MIAIRTKRPHLRIFASIEVRPSNVRRAGFVTVCSSGLRLGPYHRRTVRARRFSSRPAWPPSSRLRVFRSAPNSDVMLVWEMCRR
jgi:hypothetical protein